MKGIPFTVRVTWFSDLRTEGQLVSPQNNGAWSGSLRRAQEQPFSYQTHGGFGEDLCLCTQASLSLSLSLCGCSWESVGHRITSSVVS